MSNAYNHVTLVGNLCNEPEHRTTQNGISDVTFRIGVQRRFKDKETGQKIADFLNVVAWRNTADFVKQYIHKGDLVVVDGEIQTRTYEKDGVKRYITEVNAEDVRRPVQRSSETTSSHGAGGGDGQFTEVELGDDLPF